MSATETMQPRFNVPKLILAVGLLVAGVAAFHYLQNQYLLIWRVLGLLVVVAAAALVFYQTVWGRALWAFVQEARTELRKVVWPTRTETVQTTIVVAVVVLLVGLYLWLLDLFFGWLIQSLLAL
ncbi:MAG: protein translocase subunit SecE [Gammaproteobacteria bacterium]|nr:MAG: protein translocase subunit SecE [Gammaproteobacteria bacterium]